MIDCCRAGCGNYKAVVGLDLCTSTCQPHGAHIPSCGPLRPGVPEVKVDGAGGSRGA